MCDDDNNLVVQLAQINTATAVASALQTMLSSSTASSLAYLHAVRQSNAAATLELATLATAVTQVLTPPPPPPVKQKNPDPPPGYPVVS